MKATIIAISAILLVGSVTSFASAQEGIPDWIKTNEGWWADGAISDGEFVSGIQHLIVSGLVSVGLNEEIKQTESVNIKNTDPELTALYSDLEKCSEISTAYKRIDCQKPIKNDITLYKYKMDGEEFVVGQLRITGEA